MLFHYKQIFAFCTCASLILSCNAGLNAAETLAQQTSKDFTSVAKSAIPAVVTIKVKTGKHTSTHEDSEFGDYDDFFQRFFSHKYKNQPSEPSMGQASGFIISPEGLILTNSHVVQDATDIQVLLEDGRDFPAKVIGVDPNTEVALIKIDGEKLPFLRLGNSDKLEIGEWVVAIGNSLGLQATLTVGVVSAKGRNNLDIADVEDFIQTDAAINRGNSGGPLLNLSGEVVGMNTAIATSGNSGGYIGIGFAIPSNLIQHVVDQLKASGTVTRGFIGVSMQHIDHDLAQAFGLKQSTGALVADVSKGSPAEKAGIKQGDIIQALNNQPVTNIATLRNTIMLMNPGTKITLTVQRNGNSIQIPLEIGSYPVAKAPQSVSVSGNQLGFDVQDLTPELARSIGVGDEKGVVINKIDPNSQAALAGLKKGALIMAVNQRPITNIEQFNKALQETQADRPVLLLVKQGEAIRFISLKVNK